MTVAARPAALAQDVAGGVRLEILLVDLVKKFHGLVVHVGYGVLGGSDGGVVANGAGIGIVGEVGAVHDVAFLLGAVREANSARQGA